MGSSARPVTALVFDVFGTVVDWRTSIAREVDRLLNQSGRFAIDATAFADAWRALYAPTMQRVRSGELPWTPLDRLHRIMLDAVLRDAGIDTLTEDEKRTLGCAWHRLDPWPDVVPALRRLKPAFVIAPLSNGNVSLMVNLARHAGLPWDCVLGAELVRHYKPDPEVYRSAGEFLDREPGEVMMVAAHLYDLRAAKAEGLRTAFVARPMELGPTGARDAEPDDSVDVSARDFEDLASQLGS